MLGGGVVGAGAVEPAVIDVCGGIAVEAIEGLRRVRIRVGGAAPHFSRLRRCGVEDVELGCDVISPNDRPMGWSRCAAEEDRQVCPWVAGAVVQFRDVSTSYVQSSPVRIRSSQAGSRFVPEILGSFVLQPMWAQHAAMQVEPILTVAPSRALSNVWQRTPGMPLEVVRTDLPLTAQSPPRPSPVYSDR